MQTPDVMVTLTIFKCTVYMIDYCGQYSIIHLCTLGDRRAKSDTHS